MSSYDPKDKDRDREPSAKDAARESARDRGERSPFGQPYIPPGGQAAGGTGSSASSSGAQGYSDSDSSDERRLRERLEKLLPDLFRRAINVGTSAIWNTEDSVRRLVSEFNLPREVAAYLLMQASSSKDEVLRIISQELRRFLETVNLSGELQKLLTSLSFEIKTEIRFIPNEHSLVKPEIKNKTAVRRSRDGRDSED